MELLSSEELTNHVEQIIHADTQLQQNCIDLTVNAILKFTSAGFLDFGGSEFKPAETLSISPEKKNSDDDYGWWSLGSGRYKIEFNEKIDLSEDAIAFLTPHEHLNKAGVTANTNILISDNDQYMIIDVPEVGCNIKENARIASLFMVKK